MTRTHRAEVIAFAVCFYFVLLALFHVAFGADAPGTITLTWSAPTVNTDGTTLSAPVTYNVYSVTGGTATQVATGVSATTFVVTGLSKTGPATPTAFYVTAVENGIESAPSASAGWLVPGSPTNVKIT